MNFIGDYFAIGLVIVLCLFFFDKQHYLTKASKCFLSALVFTALTALTDLTCGSLLQAENVPLWLHIAMNSLYFLVNILATSSIALYLFTKILEHAHDNHCMINAKRGLLILFLIYLGFICANLWTGCLFYFDEHGAYHRGPLNAIGYLITICQMGLVLICFYRNKKNATKSMRRMLIQIFPIVVLCIIIQRIFPDIMLNGYIMAMVETNLFLSFQGQRQGIHALTKLNDRHRFFREIEMRMESDHPFQAFLINIKNFTSINQRYGHKNGDELLYQFAFALEKLIKKSTAFHMNGTEFALLIPYTWQKNAQSYCGTLLQFLDDGIPYLDEHIHLEYVVAEYVVDDPDIKADVFYERLEYAADLAESQGFHYIRYTPDIGLQMDRELHLKGKLRCVDREHGFQVWFQPIYCMKTNTFASMEALIRLQEPDGSMISPGEFIPLAERNDTITQITWFVLEDVCAFLSSNAELSNISTSINLPMSQLLEPGFMSKLDGIVDRYGIAHPRICLEFTERELLDSFEETKKIMMELTRSGYRFYLDDFGTGYSNFNCMLQLPLQFIKLDASLIRLSSPTEGTESFVQAITNLSHGMGMQVIAEGVETAEIAQQLHKQGVDRIQGYYYAKPMNQSSLLNFFQDAPLP